VIGFAANFDSLYVTRDLRENSNRKATPAPSICAGISQPPACFVQQRQLLFLAIVYDPRGSQNDHFCHCGESSSESQPHLTASHDGERKTETSMKLSKNFQGVLIGSAFLLATEAFAANKGTLHVSSPEIVAGQRLAAGDYTVRWDGTGPNTQFKIIKGAKVVVAAPARIVALGNASPSDSVVVQIEADGSRRVSQMCFSGQKLALQIEESSGSAIVQGNN
jgi:hypothetical protein